MKRTILQFLLMSAVVFVTAVGIASWNVYRIPGTGTLSQRLINDNAVTTGEVTEMRSSKMIYVYNTPHPRHPWFQRSQAVKRADIRRYKVGMKVPIEYSRTRPGVSRVKGFGHGSIYLHEQLMTVIWLCGISIPVLLASLLFDINRERLRQASPEASKPLDSPAP